MSAKYYGQEMAKRAHEKFESLVKECVERNLDCSAWEGLASKRLACTGGVFTVDGKPVCATRPVVFEDGAFKFYFEDLTK